MPFKSDEDTAAYYNGRPRKRTGAGFLIFNRKGQLLIVKPNYLNRWLYPGGGVEESESPFHAALRECKEEIGIEPIVVWPAYIDYQKQKPTGETDVIQFTFTTEPVDDDFLKKLTLQHDEIDDAKFVDISELGAYLSEARTKAIQAYCKYRGSKMILYLENGDIIS